MGVLGWAEHAASVVVGHRPCTRRGGDRTAWVSDTLQVPNLYSFMIRVLSSFPICMGITVSCVGINLGAPRFSVSLCLSVSLPLGPAVEVVQDPLTLQNRPTGPGGSDGLSPGLARGPKSGPPSHCQGIDPMPASLSQAFNLSVHPLLPHP